MATFKQLLNEEVKTNLIDFESSLKLKSCVPNREMAWLVQEYEALGTMDYSFSQFLKDVVLADLEFAQRQPEYKFKQRITASDEKLLKAIKKAEA